MNLAERTVSSAGWNFIAKGSSVVLLFVRSVLLARWLPIETFGIYGYASAIVILSSSLLEFGMGSAFIHRSPETQNESEAASAHITLKLIFALVWAGAMLLGSSFWADGDTQLALYVLTLVFVLIQISQTPRLILVRRVVHRRLALIEVVSVFISTAVGLLLALRGVSLWSLLAIDIAAAVTGFVMLYVWKPFWRPRLLWRSDIFRYYMRFGSRLFLAGLLSSLLDRIDDLWIGFFLGERALGFYSRAYRFATYPRSIIASPIDSVAGGAYAEVKHDRGTLSKLFFRLTSFTVRLSFLIAGVWFLIAPEFIRLVLGERWMPMLIPFQLMLVFVMLDPVKGAIANLFVAVGEPGTLTQVRLLQLVVLVGGLFALGIPYGITGVALAVDLMLVVGLAVLLFKAGQYVDFSLIRMFGAPTIALVFGVGIYLLSQSVLVVGTLWLIVLTKSIIYGCAYLFVLFFLERDEISEIIQWLSQWVRRS